MLYNKFLNDDEDYNSEKSICGLSQRDSNIGN